MVQRRCYQDLELSDAGTHPPAMHQRCNDPPKIAVVKMGIAVLSKALARSLEERLSLRGVERGQIGDAGGTDHRSTNPAGQNRLRIECHARCYTRCPAIQPDIAHGTTPAPRVDAPQK